MHPRFPLRKRGKKKTKKRFRDEFPFLDRTDCPIELQTLATRKISAYRAYVHLHQQLTQCVTREECADVAGQLILNYIDNRLMWLELDYYRQHNAILGKHPIFDEFKRRQQLLSMKLRDLLERKKQVEMNIWRTKSLIKKGGSPDLQTKRQDRLKAYEAEMADILRLIGD